MSMETLHPREWLWLPGAAHPNAIGPRNTPTAKKMERPSGALLRSQRARAWDTLGCVRIEAGPEERDFPILEEFFADGATDYMAQLFIYGEKGDRSQGTGIVYSFTTDRKGGFSDDDATLVQATLPALSLAMKAHAGHVIASGLLGAYLGEDAGARVHAGSVLRGSVDNLRAVLWYADIRGFTPLSDSAPGAVVVELLNDVFEILTASR